VLAHTLSPLVPVLDYDMEAPDLRIEPRARSTLPAGVPRRCDQKLLYGKTRRDANEQRVLGLSLEGSVCDAGNEADRPRLSSSYQYTGARALELTLPPRRFGLDKNGERCTVHDPENNPCIGPDRAELTALSPDFEAREGVGFNMGSPKYLGFAMYLALPSGGLVRDPSSIAGAEGVHFMQAWQFLDNIQRSCGVPLVATLENAPEGGSSPLQFSVRSSNDPSPADTIGKHSVGYTKSDGTRVISWFIEPNQWHTFIFYLKPNSISVPGTGVVKIWYDGRQIVDWHRNWGCDVTSGQDNWHLRVGMYRAGPGIIDQTLQAFFDNVRVAFSKKQADPDELQPSLEKPGAP
jgi:hypothetical protein